MICHVVCGPTASGKSNYALSIPNADIINGDSLQIYTDLNILTARPDPTLPHHYLYGFVEPDVQINVMTWRNQVAEHIKRAHDNGRTPVVVGGTGFYLDVLINGISPIPEVPQDVIDYVRGLSIEQLQSEAQKLDGRILIRFVDRQRIQRAIAVQLGTGQSLFDWQEVPKDCLPYIFKIHNIQIERDVLNQRINRRFEEMISQGAIEEVLKLKETYPDVLAYPLAHAIGFKEIYAYLDGQLSKSQMIELGQQKTRQYAKRQTTWFKKF